MPLNRQLRVILAAMGNAQTRAVRVLMGKAQAEDRARGGNLDGEVGELWKPGLG